MPEDLTSIKNKLRNYNPWWYDNKWYEKDQNLLDFYNSVLKVEPRLYYHITQKIIEPYYGIITIRGPRRAGKTTLLKLVINHLIHKLNVNPPSIFYISLDYQGLKDVELVEILEIIANSSNDEKYIFLDEVSMYKDWALALKNIYDMGLVEKAKLKIIATGSHSMDLAEAVSKLRNRQGNLASRLNLGGNLIHRTLRFSEVIEALKQEIDKELQSSRFRKVGKRFQILQALNSGIIDKTLENIHNSYYLLLAKTFDEYLIHGGYPKVIDMYNKKGTIDEGIYKDIAKLLIDDSEKAGLNPNVLNNILLYLTDDKRLSGLLNLSDLASKLGISHKDVKERNFNLGAYLTYLKSASAFFFVYQEESECMSNVRPDINTKNYVLDPFLYFSLYSYLRNVPNPFKKSVEMLKDENFKGLLVESTVASHLLNSQFLFEHISDVKFENVLMYTRNEKGETDFILCVNKSNVNYRFLIECKYRNKPEINKKSLKDVSTLIVLTKDKLGQEDFKDEKGNTINIVYIPVPEFLLLF
ncbi:hypothetical protein STK_13230 [Sulfurisphaera tokodaii str. 7]|uniref:AAA+ ATPase domain-containing protein n=1 Tax=Sulfurisphaera tokodaii (strain DSM 16993 / JCM 10545 / NBRC 100140 / 7) TaxID=273063 RepID=F9VP22_SULTO|nr:AAA family ATPase [Sulfurisphaera tokodaii]BAK54530.1 hypothetical protein STK_13230 [Sulfurisphaera tokodaii str. 7]